MYQAHFGLKTGLFDSGIAQESAVFLGPKQELIVANCKIALTTLDSAIVLTGAAGVGKTTLAATALRETSTRLALGWLSSSPANTHELLELLLAEFGFSAARVGRVERLQMWRQFLNETNATDSRAFVIVERAEDMPVELLRSLESLTAADPNGCRGANLVLLGQPGLNDHLKAPALESLRQRIRLRQRIEPYTVTELRDYLAEHIARAGGAFDKVFAADAVAALHQHSGGIARVVNNLCETALTLAATRREQQLTGALISRVAVGLFGLDAQREPTGEGLAPAAPASARAPDLTPTTASTPTDPAPAAPAPTALAPTAPPVAPTVAPTPTVAAAEPSAPLGQPKPSGAPALAAAPSAPAAAASPPEPNRNTPASAAPRSAPPTPPPKSPVASSASHRPLLMPTPPAPATTPEFDGSETDIADEILTAQTLADEAEVVQMAEFPVLTDAVEDTAAAPPEAARAAPAASPSAAKPPLPSSGVVRSRIAPAATAAARAPAPSAVAAPKAPPPAAATRAAPATAPAKQSSPPAAADDDEQRQTQTMRALATAKSLDDISNSMAETLFGEADLDMLSAALASAGWSEYEDDAPEGATTPAPAADAADTASTASAAGATPAAGQEPDPFDLFDLGPDAPLELIDDSSLPPQKKPDRIKIANR